MLNIEERQTLKSKLPRSKSHGYALILKKLPHLTRNQISQAFQYDNRYKEEVMVAATKVIEENEQDPLKSKVASL